MSAHLHQRARFALPCEACAEKDETIRQLRAALIPPLRLPPDWGFQEKEAQFVLALFRAAPGVIPHSRMFEILWPEGDEPTQLSMDMLVFRARRKLRKNGIDFKTVRDIGRYMPKADADRLKAMLNAQ